MDSSGRIHMFKDFEGGLSQMERERLARLTPGERPARFEHSGFVSHDPMPEACDPRRVLSALEKVCEREDPVTASDAALAPLTPMEKGYVLGALSEYRAWKAGR